MARNPQARIRDIAAAVGVTDRAAQTILNDLVDAGYLSRSRHGRRNTYSLNIDRPLRHPLEQDHAIGDLLRALDALPDGDAKAEDGRRSSRTSSRAG